MALKKFDSFSHYAIGELLKKWPYSVNASGLGVGGTGGRRGGGRLSVNWYANNFVADVFANHNTWIVGGFFNTLGFAANIFHIADGATTQVMVSQTADGYLKVYRGSTSNLLATSNSVVFLASSKHYIEFKAVIHGSTGSFEVHIDGVAVAGLTVTGANTQASANAYANKIKLGDSAGSGGPNIYYEDVYICDGSGSAPCNDFLGDCKVVACYPTGNGTTSNFVGSDTNSTDNYLLVDEAAPNTTDYINSLTPNDVDLVNVTDIADTPSVIYGVQTNLYACKSDAGTVRTVADLIRSGGTDYPGVEKTLGTDWVYLCEIHEKNPNTDAAWTKTNFNSAEFGVKMVS